MIQDFYGLKANRKGKYKHKLALDPLSQNINNIGEFRTPIRESSPAFLSSDVDNCPEFDDTFPMDYFTDPRQTFQDELENFAVGIDEVTYGEKIAGNSQVQRSSLASFRSLQRRMAFRIAKPGQQLKDYSAGELRLMQYVMKRLSVGSLVSKCSKTTASSLSSYRLSPSAGSLLTLGHSLASRPNSSTAIEDLASNRRSSTDTITQHAFSQEIRINDVLVSSRGSLANHTNVHSRSNSGKSLLEAATKSSINAAADGNTALYARILACINIARKHGAVEKPAANTEWDERINCEARTKLQEVIV
jgi:hypothetical protein